MLKQITQSKLNDVCYDIRGPVLTNALQNEGQNIKAQYRQPGFWVRASDEIISNVRNALLKRKGILTLKILEARQAIMEELAQE